MIRNKKKFIDSYTRYISSKDSISSNQTFLYTTNLSWTKFENCIDIEDSKLKNIFLFTNLQKNIKCYQLESIEAFY